MIYVWEEMMEPQREMAEPQTETAKPHPKTIEPQTEMAEPHAETVQPEQEAASPQPFIAYAPIWAHPLPEGHRFPMLKYELIPGQLLHEGVINPEHIFSPAEASDEIILRTHDAGYWHRMKTLSLTDREMRAVGFPLSAALVERERRIAQGTLDCARISEKTGVAFNVAGGTHHAFADRGEGFCLLNDFAIAANVLLDEAPDERILICDLDVHQGNGTAALFAKESRVFTFSMHGQHNYPFRKEQSTLDIGLPDGTNGADYLALLREALPPILAGFRPTRIFYLAGVDVLDTDKFGKLKLTLDDCRERDRFVLQTAKDAGLPVTVAMGGGYSADVKRIVEAHCNTYRLAVGLFSLAL